MTDAENQDNGKRAPTKEQSAQLTRIWQEHQPAVRRRIRRTGAGHECFFSVVLYWL